MVSLKYIQEILNIAFVHSGDVTYSVEEKIATRSLLHFLARLQKSGDILRSPCWPHGHPFFRV